MEFGKSRLKVYNGADQVESIRWRPTHILTKIYFKQISTKNEPDFLL